MKLALSGLNCWIEPKDVEEDLLDHVFGFGLIAQNPARDSKEKGAMTFEEDGQRVSIAVLKESCEALIRLQLMTQVREQGWFGGRD